MHPSVTQRIVFICTLIACNISSIIGQYSSQNIKSYALEEGLSNPFVISIYQDDDGFVWISNKSAVDRFDGYSFEPLSIPHNDSLQIENFACIYIDKDGYKYVGTENNGMLIISPDGMEIEIFAHDPMDSLSISNNYVDPIIEDAQGRIWVGTYGGGLNLFNKETRTFTSFDFPIVDKYTSLGKNIYKIKEDKEGNIWFATDGGGLYKIESSSSKIKRYIHDPEDPYSIADNYVFDLSFDNQERLWLATYGDGLSYLDLKTMRFHNFNPALPSGESISSAFTTAVTYDGDNGLWIGYEDKGMDFYDFQDQTLERYNFDQPNGRVLLGNAAYGILQDQEKNIWIQNHPHGVGIARMLSTPFESIEHEIGNKESIKSNRVAKVLFDGNSSMWIAYENEGLDRVDLVSGEVEYFHSEGRGYHRISDNSISDIEMDANGKIWIGTKYGGVNMIDPSKRISQIYDKQGYPNNGPYSNWIFDLTIGSNDKLWIGYTSGLSSLDCNTSDFTHFVYDEQKPNWLDAIYVKNILEDSNGELWLFTELEELTKLNPETSTFSKHELPKHVSFYKDDTYWNYEKGAIQSVNLITGTIKNHEFVKGLTVNGMIKDNDGDLWVASNEGLWRYNISDESYIQYNKEDGLLSNRLLFNHTKEEATGKLYFTTDKGINFIHPDDLTESEFVPPVVISKFQYFDSRDDFNEPYDQNNIQKVDRITFPHHINFFKIDFAALSFSKTGKNQYRYRMKGLSNNWFELGTERSVTLNNLDPGIYNLHIQASNGDGVWNREGKKLDIIIKPPWWLSIWAYVAYVILFCFTIWSFIKWRIRTHTLKLNEERKIVERLKEVDKLKDQFLANTSHELRTPLNGIIGLSESLKDGVAGKLSVVANENLDMIISSGKRLSNLVNDILDFSKMKNHELSLNIVPVDLFSAVNIVIRMSRPLLKNKTLRLENHLDHELPLVSADENRVQQILHNLIGNAIKFTHDGSVIIRAEVEGVNVKTTIVDTGIGIAKENFEKIFRSFDQIDGATERAYGGSGLGLAVTKQLVEQHGGDVLLISEVGKGTEISFTLPISKVGREEFVPSDSAIELIEGVQELDVEDGVVNEVVAQEKNEFTILIVDDEPVNRQVLQNHLGVAGYNVFEARNGKGAIELIDSEQEFNLVLLDIMMPEMSGYQVAAYLRQKYSPSELPIIMLTAKNRVDDLVAGFNVGASDYLTKPFLKDELLSRVRIHLNIHKMHSATSKFVPQEFIRAIGRKNIVDVELGDYVERNVSVLFTDIREYTGIAEKMSPKENFDFVRTYVERMGPIIQENNGFVNQYLGDGIMAIFDQSVDESLQATISMQLAIDQINKERAEKNQQAIKVGMGIASGPLIMGIIGDERRKDPTTIATTVNVASRIEGLTKFYGAKISLDFETKNKLAHPERFNIRDLGKAQVKGQKAPIDIYECFDGDSAKVVQLKRASLDDFHKALEYFEKGEFQISKNGFLNIFEENPEDLVAKYFYDRCVYYIEEGVDKNWSGIEKLKYK